MQATKAFGRKASAQAAAPGPALDGPLTAGEAVMHPAHGVGRVERIAEEEVAGQVLRLVQVVFAERNLTVRIPVGKVEAIGLRRLAPRAVFDEALSVLKGRPRASKVMWARRAAEYQAKINSGDPRMVAEVIRDLGRSVDVTSEASFSERQLFETALDRLACEFAAVEGTDKAAAAARITALLVGSRPRARQEEDGEEGEGEDREAA